VVDGFINKSNEKWFASSGSGVSSYYGLHSSLFQPKPTAGNHHQKIGQLICHICPTPPIDEPLGSDFKGILVDAWFGWDVSNRNIITSSDGHF